LFATHYPTAIGAGLPPLAYALWRLRQRKGVAAPVLLAALGGAAGLALLGAYHHAVHGEAPWLFPASQYEHGLLAVRPSLGWVLRGLAYTALHGLRFLAWTFPLLAVLAFVGSRRKQPLDRLLTFAIAGMIALYFFYPSAGGPQYGPRYYFGLLGPVAILAARAFDALGETAGRRVFRGALVLAAVALFAVRAPLEANRSAIVNAPFRLAAGARLDHAVVFMRNVNRSDTGRNLPGWQGPVLFGQDLGAGDSTLFARYPGRGAYRFRWVEGRARLDSLATRDGASPP
jgi:hypothetical protein